MLSPSITRTGGRQCPNPDESNGTISADKAKKISGFADYTKAAATLSEARRHITTAKAKVKDALKKQLKEDCDIDFSVDQRHRSCLQKLVEKKVRTSQAGQTCPKSSEPRSKGADQIGALLLN